MSEERLSLVAPDLAERIKRTTDEAVLRRAAHAAATAVVGRANAVHPLIDQAMTALAQGEADRNLGASVTSLVDEWDEQAWDAQDAVEAGEASEEAYSAAFARARAAGAVAAALDADPAMAALEAAYEAHCAFEDGAGVLDAVTAALEPG